MPSQLHDARVRTLDTIADLIGYHSRVPSLFLGGASPDVVRVSTSKRALFIGDAKATETPGMIATASRLRNYFQLTKQFIASPNTTAIFLLCVEDLCLASRWLSTCSLLCCDTEMKPIRWGVFWLSEEHSLTWMIFGCLNVPHFVSWNRGFSNLAIDNSKPDGNKQQERTLTRASCGLQIEKFANAK